MPCRAIVAIQYPLAAAAAVSACTGAGAAETRAVGAQQRVAQSAVVSSAMPRGKTILKVVPVARCVSKGRGVASMASDLPKRLELDYQ